MYISYIKIKTIIYLFLHDLLIIFTSLHYVTELQTPDKPCKDRKKN